MAALMQSRQKTGRLGSALHFLALGAVICVVVGSGRTARSEVLVAPGNDLTQLVAASPPGTRFVLLPGKHYAGDIQPKDRQTFEGQPGAILSGAVRLGPFAKAGQYWKASGPSPLPLSHGSCDHALAATAEACLLREDLFVDEVPLKRVQAIDQLRDGTWYQFRTTGEVLLPFDPTGRLVEMSYRSAALNGAARDVTISHLTIEQYASIAQHGAIEGVSGSGWVVSNNIVRFNGGTGIRTGRDMRVQSNLVTSNGQLGIGGGGDDLFIEGNKIVGNNTHAFSPGWEAGATKFWATNQLMFVRNCVQDNGGHGIWTDTDNRNASIIGNWSINNIGAGIFHEISGHAIIADNVSALNGSRENSPWASQILISGSVDTMVWHNRLEVAPNYGRGIFIVQEGRPNESKIISDLPEYDARSDVVLGNKITFLGSAGVFGFYSRKGNASVLTLANRFEDNEIVAPEGDTSRFRVGSKTLDLSHAQEQGQELRSRLVIKGSSDLQSLSRPVCPLGIGPRRVDSP
jgi:Right handed beta helix region